MGAIVAATLTAVGSAAIAAWQTRGLLREARVLESEWEVETGFRWPNARRDSAELGAPAPAGLLRRVRQRALAKFGVPTYPGPRAESQGATEVDDEYAGHEPMDWNEDSNSELSVYDRDECDAPANDFDDAPSDEAWKLPRRDKTPLDALRYAPFLLDAAPRAAWAILLGSLTLLALFGPQVTPGATQLSAVLIPLATLALASLYPLPWGWAMLAVGWLQAAIAWGYSWAGGVFQPDDASFCVAMYLANAVAVAVVAARSMRVHGRWIVMRAAN